MRKHRAPPAGPRRALSLYLPEQLRERLATDAERRGLTLSAYVNDLIADAVAARDLEEGPPHPRALELRAAS